MLLFRLFSYLVRSQTDHQPIHHRLATRYQCSSKVRSWELENQRAHLFLNHRAVIPFFLLKLLLTYTFLSQYIKSGSIAVPLR